MPQIFNVLGLVMQGFTRDLVNLRQKLSPF